MTEQISGQEPTPFAQGFRQHAEWDKQKCVWIAWPAHADLWQEDLSEAQRSVSELAKAIAAGGAKLQVLVLNAAAKKEAKKIFDATEVSATYHITPYGDIWLRDTAPIFLSKGSAARLALCFGFNGWGGKYPLEGDANLSTRIAKLSGSAECQAGFILEGGAVEPDGQGTALTTEQCLLNPNRNAGLSRRLLEQHLREMLGYEQIIWLEKGLLNDHTDGHIDNIARFIAPGVVACLEPLRRDDPNRETFNNIYKRLKKSRDITGKKLEVVTIPSPGPVLDRENQVMAASYLNFLISNNVVVVPLFRTSMDEQAYYRFTHLFPDKKIVGVECWNLLMGGGTLHCITQPEFA